MSAGPEEPRSSPSLIESTVHSLTSWLGSTPTIMAVLAAIALWLLSRPLFTTRQEWQDAVVVPTTVLTFLLIFLLQRSQNKAVLALQLKLNEIIASQHGASNRLIDLENLSEADVKRLHKHYQLLAESTKGDREPGVVHSIEEATRS